MKIKTVKALLKKEFLNIIRDRKSFIIMILLPLLMFPLIIGLMGFLMTSFTKVDGTIKLGVNYELDNNFKEFINNYDENYQIEIIYDSEDNLKKMFNDNEIGVYVIKNNNEYNIHYDENNTNYIGSTSIILNIYDDYKETYIKNILNDMNINYDQIKDSFKINSVQESVTEMGSLVPSIIAMALTLIISSVSFSVAIDVTTSEKEKGTLETLLSLPISKTELIFSKFLTVFLLSVMSGLLTYISLFGTLFVAKDTLKMLGVIGITINFKLLTIYFISIILLSLMFSGLLLSITIFSKNLKEAQNSLYPLEILMVFISYLPMLGVNASTKYALIPFANISLLFNNALSTNIDLSFVILTFISSIVYAIILMLIVSKLYSQEEVLFNSKKLSYMTFKNGKNKTNSFTILATILMLIIVLLLSYYFSLIFITANKYVLLAITPVTIGLVILVASLLVKLDFKENFKFRKFNLLTFAKIFLLYIGTYFTANFIIDLIVRIFPNLIKNYEAVEGILTVDNFGLALLVIAVLPAIFEELLFRGVTYNAIKKKYGVGIAIVISALIFGIYHMNFIQGVFASLLGLVLAYSYYKTNSILVPMIIHFINNSLAVIAEFYPNLNFEVPYITSVIITIIAVILIIISLYLLEHKKEKHN